MSRIPGPFRLLFYAGLIIGLFVLGRYSAYGAAKQIPMTSDQFLISMGTVKSTLETLNASQDRIIQIMTDQSRGKYTPSQATQMVQAERNSQESQVVSAVGGFLNRNAQIGKTAFAVPPGEMTDEMLHLIEYVQTKFPSLFSRYMN